MPPEEAIQAESSKGLAPRQSPMFVLEGTSTRFGAPAVTRVVPTGCGGVVCEGSEPSSV